MKKFIFTENQMKTIIDSLINEDDEQRRWNMVVQCFLNKKFNINPPLKEDGIIGDETRKYILNYQKQLNIENIDGIWGEITMSKMTDNDKKLYNICRKKKFGGLF